jgi:hypothetical protein
MENYGGNPIVAFNRRHWGRLQARAFYALIDLVEAKTSQISRYCWDNPPTPSQLYSQRRACKSIGARPVRRKDRQWIWRLDTPDATPK